MIHPTAVISEWVTLGKNVTIHPYAVVGRLPSASGVLARTPTQKRFLHIGDNTEIGCHSIIYGGVVIGSDCLVGDRVTIREDSTLGNRCLLGIGVTLGYEALLYDDVRIMEGSHITGRSILEDGVFVGLNVTTSNDRRIDTENYRYDPSSVHGPIFREKSMIGSGANVLPGVVVGKYAKIAAGAVVVKDVPDGILMIGPRAQAQ